MLNQLTSKFSTMSSELIEKSKSTYGIVKAIVVEDANINKKWTKCHVDSTISKLPSKPAILRTNQTLRSDGSVL